MGGSWAEDCGQPAKHPCGHLGLLSLARGHNMTQSEVLRFLLTALITYHSALERLPGEPQRGCVYLFTWVFLYALRTKAASPSSHLYVPIHRSTSLPSIRPPICLSVHTLLSLTFSTSLSPFECFVSCTLNVCAWLVASSS